MSNEINGAFPRHRSSPVSVSCHARPFVGVFQNSILPNLSGKLGQTSTDDSKTYLFSNAIPGKSSQSACCGSCESRPVFVSQTPAAESAPLLATKRMEKRQNVTVWYQNRPGLALFHSFCVVIGCESRSNNHRMISGCHQLGGWSSLITLIFSDVLSTPNLITPPY